MVRLGSTVARLKLKGIDGDPHKQRSVWFNSKQREEPYQGLTCLCTAERSASLRGGGTGAAWLSSARAVRCWVKSRNERNPCRRLQCFRRDCRDQRGGRWGWRQVSTALTSWATHTLKWLVQRAANPRGGANPSKTSLSSDWRLQPASMKWELLVTVGQHTTVNTFPGLVHTARHTTKVGNP